MPFFRSSRKTQTLSVSPTNVMSGVQLPIQLLPYTAEGPVSCSTSLCVSYPSCSRKSLQMYILRICVSRPRLGCEFQPSLGSVWPHDCPGTLLLCFAILTSWAPDICLAGYAIIIFHFWFTLCHRRLNRRVAWYNDVCHLRLTLTRCCENAAGGYSFLPPSTPNLRPTKTPPT